MPNRCGKGRERHMKQLNLIIFYAKPLRERQGKAYETAKAYNLLCQIAASRPGKGIGNDQILALPMPNCCGKSRIRHRKQTNVFINHII